MKHLVVGLICHWQFCNNVGDDWFACGTPKHGTEAEMRNEISRVLPPKYEHHECVKPGEKTPAWLKSSGIYRLEPVK